jgi:hypothetical protein
VLFGEHLSAAPIAGSDGDQSMAELPGRANDGEVGYPGCTEHPDSQRHTGMLRHTFHMNVTLACTSRTGP